MIDAQGSPPIFQAWLAFILKSPDDDASWPAFSAGWEACRLEVFGDYPDMAPPAFDVEHIDHVLINGTNFTPKLWRLMQTCDRQHYAQLAKAFPKHAAALEAWKAGPNTDHDHNLEEI